MAERPTRILLADDEQAILTLLSYPLHQDGYEVVRASNGWRPWRASTRATSTSSCST